MLCSYQSVSGVYVCIVSYDGEGLLMRLASSTATMSTSTSPTPHSPLELATVGSTGRAPFYNELSRDSESSRNGTTTTTAMYSETSKVGCYNNTGVYIYIYLCAYLLLVGLLSQECCVFLYLKSSA